MPVAIPFKHLSNLTSFKPKHFPSAVPLDTSEQLQQPELPELAFDNSSGPLLCTNTSVSPFDSLVDHRIAAESLDLTFEVTDLDSIIEPGIPSFAEGTDLQDLRGCLNTEPGEGVPSNLLDEFVKYTTGSMVVTEDTQAFNNAMGGFSSGGFNQLASSIAEAPSAGVIAEHASSFFGQLASEYGVESINVTALVQQVLRESYLIQSEHLLDYAKKVKFYSNVKKAVRKELEGLREALTSVVGEDDEAMLDRAITPTTFSTDYAGPESKVILSKGTMSPQTSESAASPVAPGTPAGVQDPTGPTVQTSVAGTRGRNIINRGYNGSEDYQKISEHKEEVRKRLVTWLGNLSPAQREAVAKHWEENGLGVMVRLQESDGLNEDYWSSTNGKKGEDVDHHLTQEPTLKTKYQSNEDYIADVLDQFYTDFEDYVSKKEGEIEIERISTKVDSPIFKETTIEPTVSGPTTYINPEFQRETVFSLSASNNSTSAKRLTNKKELDTHITKLEELLNTVGDDAQLANVDLQNALQKQQQVLQMMSTISKLLHDTAMAVIRKIA